MSGVGRDGDKAGKGERKGEGENGEERMGNGRNQSRIEERD